MKNILIILMILIPSVSNANECEYHEVNCKEVELEQSGKPGEIVIVCDVIVVCNE